MWRYLAAPTLSHSLSLTYAVKLEAGVSKALSGSLDSKLPCLCCGKVTSGLLGILCGNYWVKRGNFDPCKGFWCPGCFTAREDWFPIKQAFDMDKEGMIAVDSRDKNRFMVARAGDHLMNEFQCDTCHFRTFRNGIQVR